MENVEDIIDKGNEIASMNDRSNAHEACIHWTDTVRQWLAEIIPGTGYSAEWASLGAPDLVMDNSVGSDPNEWVPFREMMNHRLIWLSKLQQERLTPSVFSALILACEIEKFKFCGPSDDPDEQTAVVYGFKHIAKRFSGMITNIPMLTIPSNVNLDIEYITEAYDLHTDLLIVVDNLRSIIVDSDETEIVDSKEFISLTAIEELEDVQTTTHDTRKLIRFCEEINSSYNHENLLAVMLLLRALINHVPPIFGFHKFKEVVAQSSRSLKEIFKPLEEIARDIADHHSHATIRHNEPLPSRSQVDPFKPNVEFLIHELATKLKSLC